MGSWLKKGRRRGGSSSAVRTDVTGGSLAGANRRDRGEIAKLEARYERLKQRGDLLLEVEQLTGRQIQLIEVKREEGAFLEEEYRTGIRQAVARPLTPSVEAGGTATSATDRPPPILPGLPIAPSSAPAPPPTRLRTETAEQIEALKEVSAAEAEQASAERSLDRFADIKQLFDQQLDNERRLLELAEETRQVLGVQLDERTLELEELTTMEEKEGVGASRRDVQASIAARTSELAEIEAVIEERTSVVAALARRSEISDAELRRRADELQELRELSEASRKAAFWLQSPIHPRNVWAWMVARGPRMLFVIVATVVLLAAVRLSIFRLVRTVVGHKGGHGGGVARADTLALSFSGFSSLLIVVGGFFVLAQEAGVDLKTVLGGAAVLGVAIAFSAQNLMRDYFSGFMIHLDDPELMGVQALTESGATLRLSLKTKAGEMFSVRREMFRRIKNAFDEVGIEMGVPHRTVGESGAGSGGN